MSRVRSRGSKIEHAMETALRNLGLKPTSHPKLLGRPDFVFRRAKIAIFCDSHFWHGYRWKTKKRELRRNRSFWLSKIEGNIRRDRFVTRQLRRGGWTVLRFWEHQILRSPDNCATHVRNALVKGVNRSSHADNRSRCVLRSRRGDLRSAKIGDQSRSWS